EQGERVGDLFMIELPVALLAADLYGGAQNITEAEAAIQQARRLQRGGALGEPEPHAGKEAARDGDPEESGRRFPQLSGDQRGHEQPAGGEAEGTGQYMQGPPPP